MRSHTYMYVTFFDIFARLSVKILVILFLIFKNSKSAHKSAAMGEDQIFVGKN